ncbi:DUF6542 domain-containing protein [Streptomyces sp. HPF1205]|uniref:DUF6542 domain-containing protein n=1 Tax=Streptomyces sp. HPF1205 TaxID=2873262 RepID=UPI001CECBD07|nr:DUF6542 domain-containing protein [Streptomyces sp. HPF1205]
MDQHSAHSGPGPSPAPGPGGEAAAGVYRAARPTAAAPPPPGNPVAAVVRRLRAAQRPRPRLTGLGTGLLTTVVTVLGGLADSYLFDGPGVLFGVVFVAVSVAGAVYVRPYDLVAAPVAAPIAFAVGIALSADDGGGGLVGHLIGVFTGLALMTGWLYTGTALAALIVSVRALLRPWRRRRSRRCSAAPRGRSPR